MMRFSYFLAVFSIVPISSYAQEPKENYKNASEIVVQTYINSKWIPDSIFNLRIVAGKKFEVQWLSTKEVDLSTNNYRQALRKTPGIFVSEHDASGLQTSIATRGLSANRSWEFNMRQNGYDIAADPSGYPEAYYTPTLDAVAAIHVYRGSSALQYGSQFGGMIDYQLKDALGSKAISYESSQTVGSFGTINSFNALGGNKGRWTYYGFLHHRQSKGYRLNSGYYTNNYFGKVGYAWSKGKITLEYTNSYYLSQQPGGLHDTVINLHPDTSLRARNWFELPWKVASLQLNHQFKRGLKLQALVNYLHGNRNSVGFTKGIQFADTFNVTLNSYNPRDVDKDIYNTLSSEVRLNHAYAIGKNTHTLTGGIRFCLSDIRRLQKGKGTGNSMADFTTLPTSSGYLFQRDLHLQTQNLALFAEHLFLVGKRLSFSPGFRLESLQSSLAGRSDAFLGGYLQTQHKNRWIALGGISAKLSAVSKRNINFVFYANANQNYRPVTYSEWLPSATTEHVDSSLRDANGYSSEGGFKGFLLLHRRCLWSYDMNAFYLRYNHKIGSFALNGSTYKTNLGDLISKGVELYTEWMFMNPFFIKSSKAEQLNIYFSGSLIDARYQRWDNPSIPSNSVVGKQAEYAPKKVFRIGLEYKFKGFGFNYQVQYTGSCFADATNSQYPNAAATIGLIPALTLHDASLFITLFENYQLKLGINNLFDQTSVVRRVGGYPGPGALPNQGRSAYGTLFIKI